MMTPVFTDTPRRHERGWVAVTTALVLVVLCGFAALAVDIGLLLGARTSAQRAADAGALAGATTFVLDSADPQPATAVAHATAVATTNRVLHDPVTAAQVAVAVDLGARRVTVDVTRPVDTMFARVIGVDSVDVTGHAVAEASSVATSTRCAKPWFTPNTMLSTRPACTACGLGEVLIRSGAVTAWANAKVGQQLRIKPGDPKDALGPGEYFAVAMADSRGGKDYRTNIATCSPMAIICQQSYSVEPGNMIGPTKLGVKDLIGSSPDTFVSVGRYRSGDGSESDTSPQLVTMPVWDDCGMAGFCPGAKLPDNGRNIQIGVVGFAQVFIDGMSGNDVLGHLVGVANCGGAGGAGGGPQPTENGPLAIPVRLVRTQ